MLRLLHTADWHIGQHLRGFPREREHLAVFDQLVALVAEREIDAMIVAGDVFDGQNPSGESQRLLYDLLARLHQARPAMTIVMVAGNHDAAGRLEAPRTLLARFGVHVVGNVERRDGRVDLRRHLLPLKDARGEVAAQVLAVSYPTAACLPPLDRLDAPGSPIVRAVAGLYGEMVEAAAAACGGVPLVATGHLHVAGGLESEGAERRILVGGDHAVPPAIFGDAPAYVALGHLHRPQGIGRDTVRYSGSLFPLSSTEQPYRHGVCLVTLDGGETRFEHVPLARPVAFLRLPETGEMRLDELGDRLKALGLPADLPVEQRPFIDLRLAREGLTPGFRAEADRIAEGFPVRLVDARIAAAEAPAAVAAAETLLRLADRDPEDLFRRAFALRIGEAPSPAHVAAFHHLRAGL